MLVYRCEDLIPIGYTDSDFQSDLDFRKSTSGCVFTLGGGAISWQSCKVEFNQPSCWLYSIPNLLVFQQLVTLYLGEILVRVVSEIV